MQEKNPLLHSMISSCSFLASFLCLAVYGNLSILSNDKLLLAFWEQIPPSAYMEFYFIVAMFLAFIAAAVLETLIGYFFVWLVYRFSVQLIYSKPCRIYPVEKEHIFTLR